MPEKNTTHDLINAGFEPIETEDTVELESEKIDRECERLWDLHHADVLILILNLYGIDTGEFKLFFIEIK